MKKDDIEKDDIELGTIQVHFARVNISATASCIPPKESLSTLSCPTLIKLDRLV